MKTLYVIALTASLTIPVSAYAESAAETLFKQHNCAMCHALSSASVGPSVQSIAKKYAGNTSAQALLEAKVRNGGKGSFGAMPMPATPKSVSDENIKSMVRWMLIAK